MVEVISTHSVGLLWKGLAKVPLLTRMFLKWRFPVQKCRELFIIDSGADSAYFDLQPDRPSHSLGGLGLRLHNHLPFDMVVQVTHSVLIIDSSVVLESVLNSGLMVPAFKSAQLALPQIGLTEQQVRWVRNLQRDFTRIKINLDLKCQSNIRSWEEHSALGFSATINSGNLSLRQGEPG